MVEVVLNEGLIFSVGGISLAPGVGVAILAELGSELRGTLSTTDQEAAANLSLVVLTEGDDDTEGVLAGSLETLLETTSQVGGHEHLGEISVVVVVSEPERPSIGLEVLPEPGEDSSADILGVVGVNTLELLEVELGGGKEVEGVDLLGLGLSLLIITEIGGSGRGGSSGSGSSGGGSLGDIDLSLLAEREVGGINGGNKVGLTGDSAVPADDVSEGLAELGVHNEAETSGERASNDDISESDGLTDEEGVGQKVVVQGGEQLDEVSLSGLSGLSVVLNVAEDGVDPDTRGSIDLSGPVDPSINDGSLIRGSSVENVTLASN